MASRPKVPKAIELKVLKSCARRCAFCFGIDQDFSEVRGQIAHLDHDRTNNRFSNLAFLCFDHHDEYDSTSRQSKGLTRSEANSYLKDLYDYVAFRRETLMRDAPTAAQPVVEDESETTASEELLPVVRAAPHSKETFVDLFEGFLGLGEEYATESGAYIKFVDLAYGLKDGDDHATLAIMEVDFESVFSESRGIQSYLMVQRPPDAPVRRIEIDERVVELNPVIFYIILDRNRSPIPSPRSLDWMSLYMERIQAISHEVHYLKEQTKGLKLNAGIGVDLGMVSDSETSEG